ncbi:MAG: cell division protein FtsL [Pseudomonadota bacterium]
MRVFATTLAAICVVALGYWAYHQTVMTQQAVREVERLQLAIGAERERLSILRAEWAYLNRPDRLRELADINFERLGLMPLAPDQFGLAVQIPYAPPPQPDLPVGVLGSASTSEVTP